MKKGLPLADFSENREPQNLDENPMVHHFPASDCLIAGWGTSVLDVPIRTPAKALDFAIEAIVLPFSIGQAAATQGRHCVAGEDQETSPKHGWKD